MDTTPRRIALVLGGGAAHGAYEVGVLRYLHERVARDLGAPPRFDILSGTSAGAVNTCALAAYAHAPGLGVNRLVDLWQALELGTFVRVDRRALARLVRDLAATASSDDAPLGGSLLDAAPLRRMLDEHLPFDWIDDNLRSGALHAASVTTTHIASGACEVFVATREAFPVWNHNPGLRATRVRLRAEHVLASAAVPLVFPAVDLDGSLYCDGGLRQLVPLAPPCRLGADALLVINPSAAPEQRVDAPDVERERERLHASPAYLAGKALDALLLDRLDDDLQRVRQINTLLEAGERLCGRAFLDAVNAGASAGQELRPLGLAVVRPSVPLARLCADYVRSPRFRARRCGPVEWMAHWLAEREGGHEATLLSYLMFDGAFAAQLMELGQADAQREHDRLAALFAPRAARSDAA
jgi:NTE family protein